MTPAVAAAAAAAIAIVAAVAAAVSAAPTSANDLGFVASAAAGFAGVPAQSPYQYGPSIVLHQGTYYAFYCSAGANGAWDYIRMSQSADGSSWSTPVVALAPSNAYDANSVCDPSVVQFRGVWYLYHTCIHTSGAPDGYGNNRICVATADHVAGPYYSLAKPVVQDVKCPSDANEAYCVGQPSAVVHNDQVYLYYSSVYPGMPGPNPGNVLLAISPDGINFSGAGGVILTQRDVDVKVDRQSGLFVMTQGDVGSTTISWSLSGDGINWYPYNSSHAISTNPSLPSGGSNNNPGIASSSDGTIGGDTFVMYGSSYVTGWGKWHLYRSQLWVNPAQSDCSGCVQNSCDWACSRTLGTDAYGYCAAPGSRNPADCCSCQPKPAVADCHACAPSGCVNACRGAGYSIGICSAPGSTNPSACCACL